MANERVTRQVATALVNEPSKVRVTREGVAVLVAGAIPLYHWDANTLAVADGANVTSWVDQITGRDMTPAGGNAPSFHLDASPLGNMPGVRFDGNERLSGGAGASLSQMTAIMVIRNPPHTAGTDYTLPPYANGYFAAMEIQATAGRYILGQNVFSFIEFTDATLPDTFCLWTYKFKGTGSVIRANQVQRATGNHGLTSSTALWFGHEGGGAADFTLFEMLIFPEILSDGDIDIIEDYLYAKWFVLPPPDAPSGVSATTVSASEIDLAWTDTPDETGYRVERSLDGATGWTDISGVLAAGTITYSDDALDGSTEYFYRIIAFNVGGDGDPSVVVSATTDAPLPPDAPVLEGVTERVTDTTWQTILTWDDVSAETGYRIESSVDGEEPWTTVTTLAPNVVTYTITDQPSDQTIFFRVVAVNASGEAPSNFVSGITGSDFAAFTAEGHNTYVELFIQLEGIARIDYIERIGPGTEVVTVRNTHDVETISSGLWLGFDYEAPQNVPLTYKAYLTDDLDEEITLIAVMTGVVNYGGDYLMAVGRPELAMNIFVEYGGAGALSRDVVRDVVQVVGRPSPMIVTWGRNMWVGGFNFLTLEEFERRRVLAIMSFPVVMFVSRAGYGFDQPVFLSPGTVTEERTTGLGSEQSRRWIIDFNEIARPPSYYPPPLAAVSWQDRLDEDRTWQELIDIPPESWFTYGGYDLL